MHLPVKLFELVILLILLVIAIQVQSLSLRPSILVINYTVSCLFTFQIIVGKVTYLVLELLLLVLVHVLIHVMVIGAGYDIVSILN